MYSNSGSTFQHEYDRFMSSFTNFKSLSTAYEGLFLSKWRLDSVRGCELPHAVLGFIKNVGLESKGAARVCYWYKI